MIVGEEKNRGVWKKGKVLSHIKGSDGVVRGAVLSCNKKEIERPLQMMCPLEIRSLSKDDEEAEKNSGGESSALEVRSRRSQRSASRNAKEINKLLLEDE